MLSPCIVEPLPLKFMVKTGLDGLAALTVAMS